MRGCSGRGTALLLAALALTVGCSSNEPDLESLYEPYTEADFPQRNPVIVIPGILGSKLNKATGEGVWGAFSGEFADPETPEGARLFAYPMGKGPLSSLDDGHIPAGTLSTLRVRVGPLDVTRALLRKLDLPVTLGSLANLFRTLGIGGYWVYETQVGNQVNDHNLNCFQFNYDWRRDNIENAQRLAEFIREKKELVEQQRRERLGSTEPVKFDIVAHSMGAMIARYYLRYGDAEPADGAPPPLTWAGAEHVERAIMVGPPNAGSCQAFYELCEGVELSAIVPRYEGALLATLPSMYQLLPRARHGALLDAAGKPVPDILDPALWERHPWGLLDPEQDWVLEYLLPESKDREERLRIARDHVRKCLERARLLHLALDAPATPPPGLRMHLLAGDAVPTTSVLRIGEDGRLAPAQQRAGDGTVSRSSALLDERVGSAEPAPFLVSPISWDSVQFVFSSHLNLTQDPAFVDNVLYLLLVAPRDRLRAEAAAAAATAAAAKQAPSKEGEPGSDPPR